jgi:hypothetical protein
VAVESCGAWTPARSWFPKRSNDSARAMWAMVYIPPGCSWRHGYIQLPVAPSRALSMDVDCHEHDPERGRSAWRLWFSKFASFEAVAIVPERAGVEPLP